MRYKVCLVTGGGSGIGKANCKRFAQEGGKVVVVDLNDQHGNETVQEITQAKGEAIFAKCDVGNPDQIKQTIKTAVGKMGQDRRCCKRCGDDDVQAHSRSAG